MSVGAVGYSAYAKGDTSTCVSDNKYRDYSPGVDPAVACELVLVPLSHCLGASGKSYLRQSPMNERASVEVLVSREVPAYH